MKKFTFLLIVFFCSISYGIAADWNFAVVCESGQTLYCKICTDSTISLTYPAYFSSNTDTFYERYDRPTGDLIIPETVMNQGKVYYVEGVESYAFSHCSQLKTVQFPNNNKFTRIGMGAFYECYLSQELILPESIKRIESNAFCGNYFTVVTIPENCTYVGDAAFWNNYFLTTFNLNARNLTAMGSSSAPGFVQGVSRLTTINIGENVSTIPPYAFAFSSSISEINTEAKIPPTIYATTFNGVATNIRVRVPCESLSAYKEDGLWGTFTDIKVSSDCPPTEIMVTVKSNDLLMGVVTGGGKYEYATQVVVEAFPNSGYKFLQWNNGSTYNPYRFAAIEDIELIAIFGKGATAVENLNIAELPYTINDNQLIIKQQLTSSIIYNMDGRVIYTNIALNSPVELQPKMMYILHLDDKTYKILIP